MAKAIKGVVKVVGAVAAVLAVIPSPIQPIAAIVAVGASVASAGLEMIAPTKPRPPTLAGSQTQFRLDPNGGIPYMVGRTFYAGSVVDRNTWGTDNEYHGMSIVWSGAGPMAIEAFQADRVTVNFNGGAAAGAFNGFMWLNTQSGATPSPALASPIAGFPNFSGGLSGYCAGVWVAKFDKNGKKYANGLPQAGIIGTGVRCYDPRKDSTYPGGAGSHRIDNEATWERTDCPWLHGLAWALGRYWDGKRWIGVGMTPENINIPSIVDAANVADANGWKAGGMLSSTDDKWEMLKSLAQAGGGQFIRMGATLTAFVNAPRVALATIREKDIVGRAVFKGTQPIRSRINRVVPQFRSEAHGWEIIPGKAVEFAEYIEFDGAPRTTETDFALVQQSKQAAELAAYEILDARELGPIDLDLSIAWLGLEPGDAVFLDLPRLGFNGTKAIVLARGIDPTTGFVPVSLRTETDGKHELALGKTTTVPATPTLTPRDISAPRAPSVLAWAFSAVSAVGSNGETVPLLEIRGAIDNPTAEAIQVRYRPTGSTAWAMGPNVDPGATAVQISGIQPGTAYEAQIAYRQLGVLGAWRPLGNVLTGAMTASGFVGGGALAYEDALYFNSSKFRESAGGPIATLGNFKTGLGTAAAIFGQAQAATDPTIEGGATNDRGDDTRGEDYMPIYYRNNYLRRLRTEFKSSATVGMGGGTYGTMETYAGWSESSGGPVWQRFTQSNGARFIRYSLSETEWRPWQPEYSGNRRPAFDGDLTEVQGGANATLANFKTLLGTAAAFTGQGAFATLNSAAYGSSFLTGFGALSPLSSVMFGSSYLLESAGLAATLARFRTADGTAAAVTGQGSLATQNVINYGGPYAVGFGLLAGRNAVRLGTDNGSNVGALYNNAVTQIITDSVAITSQGSAASFAGQGAFATLNSAAYGSSFLTGFGALSPLSSVMFGSSYLLESAGLAATLGRFRTSDGTAAAIFGQAPAATDYSIQPGADVTFDQAQTYTLEYSVGAGVSKDLVWRDGGPMPDTVVGTSGSYTRLLVSGVTLGTGTRTETNGLFTWTGSQWVYQVLSAIGDTSNHPVFQIGPNGKPQLTMAHPNSYTVKVTTQLLNQAPRLPWSEVTRDPSAPKDLADRTSLNQAASFTGQGSLATQNAINYGGPYAVGFGSLAGRNAVRLGTDNGSNVGALYNNAVTQIITDSVAITSQGSAASFAGQGAFATVNSASYGSSLLTGFGTIAAQSSLRLGSGFLLTEGGGTPLTNSNTFTSLGTAAAIAGQAPAATDPTIQAGADVTFDQAQTYTKQYIVGAGVSKDLVWRDDGPIPESVTNASGTRTRLLVSGITLGTGSRTETNGLFTWTGSQWTYQVLSALGDTSNHPVFRIGPNGKPQLTMAHATSYTVAVTAQLMNQATRMPWAEVTRDPSAPKDLADRTSLNQAASFTGQGSLATQNAINYGGPYAVGFGSLAGRNAVRLGTDNGNNIGALYNNAVTQIITDSVAITSQGSAASFAGQGAFATVNSASYGSSLLTGFGTIAARSNLALGSGFLLTENSVVMTTTNTITASGTAAAIAGQSDWATWTGQTTTTVSAKVSRLTIEGRVSDGRALNSNNNFGLRSLSKDVAFSDSANGSTCTIFISSGSYYADWGAQIVFPAGSFPGLAYGTRYFVWRNQPDPATAGTSYGISTDILDALGTAKVLLGSHTTRAAASTPPPPPSPGGWGGGGGGGGVGGGNYQIP